MKVEITVKFDNETKELLRKLILQNEILDVGQVEVGPVQYDFYVKNWAEDNLSILKGNFVTAQDLYEHYKHWCDEREVIWPASQKKFGYEMNKIGLSRIKIGGHTRYLDIGFVVKGN